MSGERPTGSPPAGGATGRKSAYRHSVGGPASTASRAMGALDVVVADLERAEAAVAGEERLERVDG